MGVPQGVGDAEEEVGADLGTFRPQEQQQVQGPEEVLGASTTHGVAGHGSQSAHPGVEHVVPDEVT